MGEPSRPQSPDALQKPWIKKNRPLIQGLLFSGALNIGLLTSLIYFMMGDEKKPSSTLPPATLLPARYLSNNEVIHDLSLMSYQDLIPLLKNREFVEDGYQKRDLVLGTLSSLHFLNVEKALQGSFFQKRTLYFQPKNQLTRIAITTYPNLTEEQFQTVLRFIKTEQFPITSEGLFWKLQHSQPPRNPSLVKTFCLTNECSSIRSLFMRWNLPLTPEHLIELLIQGNWEQLRQFYEQQQLRPDFSKDRLFSFLADYIRLHSSLAAIIALEWDSDGILKRFDDSLLALFLDVFEKPNPHFEVFLKKILISSRSELIQKKAAQRLFSSAGWPMPDPYDHLEVIRKVLPDHLPKLNRSLSEKRVQSLSRLTSKHLVEPGDSLWKIGKKYGIPIERLKQENHLTSDLIKPGQELILPLTTPRPSKK